MVPRFVTAIALGTLVVLANAAPAVAQAPERKTLQILNDVAREVRGYANYTVFDDVGMSIENGVVTLVGKVTMPYKRHDVERRVARVQGVDRVVNRIEVLPVSPFDDELRYRISRAIYGNPSFWHYASMANPPIHIVVDRGHVTLTGVVQSNVERMMARSLATSFGAFSVRNDLRTDAEIQATLEKVTE
jgi:hyperosmotically inducible protein